jgi:hypothetical protein
MPFKQSQAADIRFVQPQDAGNPWELIEFHAAATGFPMADAFRLDVQFCGDLRLLELQGCPALAEEPG